MKIQFLPHFVVYSQKNLSMSTCKERSDFHKKCQTTNFGMSFKKTKFESRFYLGEFFRQFILRKKIGTIPA